jgi:hypothetical protein
MSNADCILTSGHTVNQFGSAFLAYVENKVQTRFADVVQVEAEFVKDIANASALDFYRRLMSAGSTRIATQPTTFFLNNMMTEGAIALADLF